MLDHSTSNLTLINHWGNKLQCFGHFNLIKATGEHINLMKNDLHHIDISFEDTDAFKDYLIHVSQVAAHHLGEQPTQLTGDRLIHAVWAKLDAIACFVPELKHYVDQLENCYDNIRNLKNDQESAIHFVQNTNLKQAIHDIIDIDDLSEPRNYGNYDQQKQYLEKVKNSWGDRNTLADHTTHPDILRELSEDDSQYVRGAVAANPNTPPSVLKDLSLGSGYVLAAVARNPSTPTDVLETLADDTQAVIRRDVASNPSTPLATLQKLATDIDEDVREEVANNKHAPMDLVRQCNEVHPKLETVR